MSEWVLLEVHRLQASYAPLLAFAAPHRSAEDDTLHSRALRSRYNAAAQNIWGQYSSGGGAMIIFCMAVVHLAGAFLIAPALIVIASLAARPGSSSSPLQ